MVAGSNTAVGYTPLQVLNSKGAVQTSGVQNVLSINDLSGLQGLKPFDVTGDPSKKVRIDLLEKNGFKPLLLGENHLVWKDGEPIDPFVLAVLVDGSDQKQQPTLLCSREIYNENKRLIKMTPYRRLRCGRAPFDFDGVQNIPKWATQNFSKKAAELISSQEYPKNYLITRVLHLQQALESTIDKATKATKMLLYLLHYGHSISGIPNSPNTTPILDVIQKYTDLSCGITASNNRNETNSRWLIKYTSGIVDVDALSDFIFGELYIPLTLLVLRISPFNYFTVGHSTRASTTH
ncbi:unnamed protein product [Adineta ricciae]|uniref:Uncharacterized protein n=1 Tax=Adineta ricciae TaxID=249248 RepID=A0A815CWN6_ADIRI|nr:unnamed protein product [Adineta ricciae]